MTHVQQSITGFKSRMKNTFNLSIAPFALLHSLFTADINGDYGSIFNSVALFFGLTSSPVLLVAGIITLGLGAVAGLAQALFFPFQLFAAKIQDSFSPLPTAESRAHPINHVYEDTLDATLESTQAPAHFPLLFEQEKKPPVKRVSEQPTIENEDTVDETSSCCMING